MKPKNEYFPEGVTAAIETTAAQIFFQEQMVEKASAFYKLLDHNSQPIENPFILEKGDSPLRKRIAGETKGMNPRVNGTSLDYQWSQLQWSVTTPYDAYRHEVSGLTAVSSWLRCENPTGIGYDILLQTLRSDLTESRTPLTNTEVENSIPVFIVPRKEDGSFNAFLTSEFSTNERARLNELDALSAAQNESLLGSELDAMSEAFAN